MSTSYIIPNFIGDSELAATDSRAEAAAYIERGYTLFTVPQMFGAETGYIVLYLDADRPKQEDANGMDILKEYEKTARNHISGGSSSDSQMNSRN